MLRSLRFNDTYLTDFVRNRSLFFFLGILLILLGGIAITTTALTSLITIFIIGVLLLITGIILLIDAFAFWWQKWQGFFLHFLLGVGYLIAGVWMIKDPWIALISLTFFIGIFYLIIGIARILFAFSIRAPHWGWPFLNGLISTLLGVLILSNWPASGIFFIGIFIGIDLLFSGFVFVMMAFAAKRQHLIAQTPLRS